VAQQLGLGFVTPSIRRRTSRHDLGNFLTVLGITLIFATDLHHLVIAALNDSYNIFRPARCAGRRHGATRHRVVTTAFRIGIQLSARFWCSPAVQSRARRAEPADAADAGVLHRPAAVDPARLPAADPGDRRDDGHFVGYMQSVLGSLATGAEAAVAEETDQSEKSEDPTQKRLEDALKRATWSRARKFTWFIIAGATLVLVAFPVAWGRGSPQRCAADRQWVRDSSQRQAMPRLFTMLGRELIGVLALRFWC